MGIPEIITYLSAPMQRVMGLVQESLESDVPLLNMTNRSLLENLGKRIRPMLSLLCAGACGGIVPDSIQFAAASELLHNATLLHDDVVDGAQQRRGRPTVMSILSGPASVLIGDYWLVKAMQCILDAEHYSERVIRMFAKTLSDLAEGEMLQLEKASRCDTVEEDYLRIIYSKTASLFEAAAMAGAVSAGAPEPLVQSVGDYARAMGIAFQIKDDMFDYSDGGQVGKPVGIDLLEQKITLPLLCALEKVSPEEAGGIRRKVGQIGDHPDLAGEVRTFVWEHGGMEDAGIKLENYIEKAVFCLSALPESTEKTYLAKLARFVGGRDY